RLTILRRHGGGLPGQLSEAVLRAVAAADFSSLRDYTRALARLSAFQEASAGPLSPGGCLTLIGAGRAAGRPSRSPPPTAAENLAPPPSSAPDEFSQFLSDVEAGVSEQVDRWRRRISDARARWAEAGLRTARLELLLEQEVAGDPEQVL